MESFINLIIFLISLPLIILLLGLAGGILQLIFSILLSKVFRIIFILLLIGFIPGIFIWDQMYPKMVAVIANDAIRIYPTRECRSKTLYEFNNSDFEQIDGYGGDSSEVIERSLFESLYYKNCTSQKSSYCSFEYYRNPISYEPSYMIDVEFNPKAYYATCYNKHPEFKEIKVPLIERLNSLNK
ncbi:hypothetical protein [Acinetobacter sp. Leaf130]|uniref:hypothetical protein n=1 Tax=Acinetobacter sp. Leaf130 TaxID=1736269 RepID=UPI0006FEBE82|nr:hypothetical protein [Acinetobacter sp. Leaf130]KQQ76122.1 hypothetical protein ASF86_01065 [Acinetobacter sp. Leaf130]